ncbi:NAD(P)-binding Rossmann-fold containing protein [Glarea lozoyensis ATCC 20868]|uniref:NAD(P)-binding Rossmann-fold containing protein n=1 Tax=Glarea lozoyensis (strain ATCC 20868 / MF5171) TaxID=1116229 RepID=S3ECX0_GLAL2|nr:NAD(P)-binding Rossmann-fold containing protein [Glarea lozoyensis ATCC 20868]EPE36143.1 NAD(P)-binding Rossmann-fold containing protein [Glarea lozoyensis ATCC 20868]
MSSTKATILLLGGTGKVASRIAKRLSEANYSVLQASRSGKSTASYQNCSGVKFDWSDESTYDLPFYGPAIAAVFIVSPPVLNNLEPSKKFIEIARKKGVNRFVLLSASLLEVGDGPAMAQVSKYIAELGVDYAILRSTWFMENFSEGQHQPTIRDSSQFYTASGDGKVPFVSADDIANVAFCALTDEKPHNTDHLILGPELFTYDEAAALISSKLGHTVTHVRITKEQFKEGLMKYGVEEAFATMLASLDTYVSQGWEANLNDVVEKVTGKKPKTFEAFVEECAEKGVWVKK